MRELAHAALPTVVGTPPCRIADGILQVPDSVIDVLPPVLRVLDPILNTLGPVMNGANSVVEVLEPIVGVLVPVPKLACHRGRLAPSAGSGAVREDQIKAKRTAFGDGVLSLGDGFIAFAFVGTEPADSFMNCSSLKTTRSAGNGKQVDRGGESGGSFQRLLFAIDRLLFEIQELRVTV
jgi:hypothetical protein